MVCSGEYRARTTVAEPSLSNKGSKRVKEKKGIPSVSFDDDDSNSGERCTVYALICSRSEAYSMQCRARRAPVATSRIVHRSKGSCITAPMLLQVLPVVSMSPDCPKNCRCRVEGDRPCDASVQELEEGVIQSCAERINA